MKNILIVLILSMLILPVQSQTECTDVVYPASGERPVINCCISRITNCNLVHYVKDGKIDEIRANAVILDGRKIFLSEHISDPGKVPGNIKFGTNEQYELGYDHYKKIFQKATIQRNIGIGMTFGGFFMAVGGLAMSYNSNGSPEVAIAGLIMEHAGIALWISGGVKRGNNRRAMDNIKIREVFMFGTTANGVGLVVKLK